MIVLPMLILTNLIFAADNAKVDSIGVPEVQALVAGSLPEYLGLIPSGQEELYGFENREEFAAARPGSPIPMYGTRASLSDSIPAAGDSSWNLPVSLKSWRVPVVVGRTARVFLTVERTDKGLAVVDFGGTALAKEIGAFETARPGVGKALLRVDALRCDVLVLDSGHRGFDDGDYYPLHSARSFFPADSLKAHTRDEVFGTIHRAVRSHRSEVR